MGWPDRNTGGHLVVMSHMTVPTITLNNQTTIPQLGFGVFQVPPAETAETVSQAFEVGYRHIDTAEMYQNEKGVGEAIASSGIARDELYVTSKLNNGFHRPDDARRAFDETLSALGLDRIVAETGVVPAVNQIEVHPYFTNEDARAASIRHGAEVEAWSPIAQGKVLDDEVINKIAANYGKTASQVTLRWHVERGDIVFPKTMKQERMRENFDIFDFTLTQDEVAQISALDRGGDGRNGPNPDTFDYIPD